MTITITQNMAVTYICIGLVIMLAYSIKPMIRFFRTDNPWSYVEIREILSWIFIPILFVLTWAVIMPPILIIDFIESAERNSIFRKIMYYRPFCKKEK